MRRSHNPDDPPVEVNLSIPQSVKAQMDLLLWDPVRKKPKYAGLSELTTKLYRAWTEEQKARGTDV